MLDYSIIRNLINTGNNPATLRYQIELGDKDSSLVTETKIDNININSKTEILGSTITTGHIQLNRLHPRNSYKSSIGISDELIVLNSNNIRSSLSLGSTHTIGNTTYEYSADLAADGVVSIYGSGRVMVTSNNHLDLEASGNALLRSWNSNVILESGSDSYTYNRGLGFRPQTSNTQYLGTSGGRWTNVYLNNQPNVSSDLRHKFAIQDIPQDLIERLSEIKPKMYLQKDKWHFGYIAQDVERALFLWATKRYGKDAKHYVDKFAMLHKDTSMLSLLYGELAVLKEQQLQSEINDLKERLDKLETKSYS